MNSDSKGTNNKRRRVDEENEGVETEEAADIAPRQLVKLPEGMRAAMGGRKFCAQDELTREVLLQYLKGKGEIKDVAGLVDVTVQTMTGRSFDVILESGARWKARLFIVKICLCFARRQKRGAKGLCGQLCDCGRLHGGFVRGGGTK